MKLLNCDLCSPRPFINHETHASRNEIACFSIQPTTRQPYTNPPAQWLVVASRSRTTPWTVFWSPIYISTWLLCTAIHATPPACCSAPTISEFSGRNSNLRAPKLNYYYYFRFLPLLPLQYQWFLGWINARHFPRSEQATRYPPPSLPFLSFSASFLTSLTILDDRWIPDPFLYILSCSPASSVNSSFPKGVINYIIE